MRSIGSAFSHINLQQLDIIPPRKEWSKPLTLDEVLKSEPKKVGTYDELVINVAQILHRTRNLTLYYRGQAMDHKKEDKTTILPSIYRLREGEKRLNLLDRFKILDDKVFALKRTFNRQIFKITGTSMLNKYPEITWSILQHYKICDTPLLDLTHSLHVACSFAFDENESKTGIVYVLGMPWQTDAIGYNTFEELVNIRLLSVCPPQAYRPFFQEGYLAGPFPNYQLDKTTRVPQFDFSRRLIAKFEIPINSSFWGTGFSQIQHDKLYPSDDHVERICRDIK